MANRKPKPPISAEEYAAWRDDPVTQVVLNALDDMADLQREAWLAASWEGGDCDPLLRATLKARADAYRAIGESGYADVVNMEEAE